MYIEPAILSAVSALTGAFMGGGASLVAALYTQRCQNRIQRATREVTKRETVYADFIMNASKSLLNAYLYDEIRLDSEQQALIGIANRMRLFAPTKVIEEAERIIRTLIQISLEPRVDLRKLATTELAESRHPDLLLPFSLACRADLDGVHQNVASTLIPALRRMMSSLLSLESRKRKLGKEHKYA
jgi:hypothetical protein